MLFTHSRTHNVPATHQFKLNQKSKFKKKMMNKKRQEWTIDRMGGEWALIKKCLNIHLPFLTINLMIFCISMQVPVRCFEISLISDCRSVFRTCKDSTNASKSVSALLSDFRKSSIRCNQQKILKIEWYRYHLFIVCH